jgi:hypothetical protein
LLHATVAGLRMKRGSREGIQERLIRISLVPVNTSRESFLSWLGGCATKSIWYNLFIACPACLLILQSEIKQLCNPYTIFDALFIIHATHPLIPPEIEGFVLFIE